MFQKQSDRHGGLAGMRQDFTGDEAGTQVEFSVGPFGVERADGDAVGKLRDDAREAGGDGLVVYFQWKVSGECAIASPSPRPSPLGRG